MGVIHDTFDRNNKYDISMITRYPVLEKTYKESLKKHPDNELLLYAYTRISSWNQLVTFYIEMVNDKY